jgi:hypothetical protein
MHDAAGEILETRVPARLDRLPWGRFHTLVVAALGITWVLDGLEVTLAGSIAGALEASPRLRFTASDIGLASSFYLAGAVIGALGFGWGSSLFLAGPSSTHRQVALRSSRVAKGRHERHPVNPPLPRFPLSRRDHQPRRVALPPFHVELPRY